MFIVFKFSFVISASALQLHPAPAAGDVCPVPDDPDSDSYDPACCPIGAAEHSSSEPDVPLKLILSTGCSGSTALMKVVEDLHRRANSSLAFCHAHREVLRDLQRGEYYQGHELRKSEVVEYLKRLVKINSAQGLPLMVKDPRGEMWKYSGVSNYLRSKGRAAMFLRSNLIDMMLCDIKDGFDIWNCRPNSEIGSCSNCGSFRGRGKDESKTMSKFVMDENHFLQALWQMSHAQSKKVQRFLSYFPQEGAQLVGPVLSEESHCKENEEDMLLEYGADAYEREASYLKNIVTYEELFAFEWDSKAVDTSSDAWNSLLRALGSNIDKQLIREYLQENSGSYDQPKSHSVQIENFDSIKLEFSKCADKYPSRFCSDIKNMWRD